MEYPFLFRVSTEQAYLATSFIFVAMLKQLLSKKLISDTEYQLIQKRLMRDYGVVSNITA